MIEDKDLAKIVGKTNVIREPEILQSYSKDISFVNSVRPECVLRLGNADEIKKIVKLANETLTPLVPVSSGTPHFRGDTIPSTGGLLWWI